MRGASRREPPGYRRRAFEKPYALLPTYTARFPDVLTRVAQLRPSHLPLPRFPCPSLLAYEVPAFCTSRPLSPPSVHSRSPIPPLYSLTHRGVGTMSGIARGRLQEERRNWRKEHPYGFHARPANTNGQTNLLIWHCGIPGMPNVRELGGVRGVTPSGSPVLSSFACSCRFVAASGCVCGLPRLVVVRRGYAVHAVPPWRDMGGSFIVYWDSADLSASPLVLPLAAWYSTLVARVGCFLRSLSSLPPSALLCSSPLPQTPWAGGIYKLVMEFSEDYPSRPPRCRFDPPLFHPNVYPSGTVCLSILDAEKGWRPSITVKQILLGVQSLLDTPNASDPANGDAYALFTRSKAAYTEKIRQIAAKSAQEAAAE